MALSRGHVRWPYHVAMSRGPATWPCHVALSRGVLCVPDVRSDPAVGGCERTALTRLVQLHGEGGEVVVQRGVLYGPYINTHLMNFSKVLK